MGAAKRQNAQKAAPPSDKGEHVKYVGAVQYGVKPEHIASGDLPGGPEGSLRLKTFVGLLVIHAMALTCLMRYDIWWGETQLVRVQILLQTIVGISSCGGAHRLWVHQAYSASFGLQAFYGIFVFAGMTGSPLGWLRSHKTHHKHSDTEMDPHNSHLGFWHSHFGWTMWEPNDALKREKLVALQGFEMEYESWHIWMDKNYEAIGAPITFALPILFCWVGGTPLGEINYWAVFWTTWVRLAVGLNMAASVNSLAHTFGHKPNNPFIEARNNLFVSLFTWGEGWHNYHHAFPKDYRASSQNNFLLYWNPTAAWILLMAYCGLAWDLKEGCSKDDPERCVTMGTFHYRYRFPSEANRKIVEDNKKKAAVVG